ncbi:sugar ABC transporter permease [Thalassorhabdomicrobium marinisediminis]|uniref:Transport permease protein n=2 Tax=Thalassorhabdomicrobium marinisediminis TaxID=2170577 RepID=A0A2T7FSV4_9RHOB|nr:sugar ABC transporter permease [Thalassorhabdomicrobium marinisediminis]
MREMATSYGRSPGGYLWAVIEPAAGIALLSALFSLGFRNPAIGTNFAIFYATGLVPFMMFTDLSNKVAMALLFSKPLLNYPSVTFLDALLGRFIVNFLTQIMVSYVVFVGILMMFETRTIPQVSGIALATVMGATLAFGVGTVNAVLFTAFPIWQRVWSILTRPLVLLSGVIFIFDNVPQPYRDYLWWNPLIHVVGKMRDSFYPTYDSSYVSYAYLFGVSAILMLFGLIFLRRYHRDILDF